MNLLLLVCTVLGFAAALPSTYDLRVQNQLLRYATYSLQTEGICAGYAWAKELAQIVGNAVGLYEQEKLPLSAQHILQCTQTSTDPCYKATLENIHDAMKRLEKEGITTAACYPNQPFSYPGKICKRECHDGRPFPFNYRPKFQSITGLDDMGTLLKKTEKIAFMAIIKVDEAFNYYSPFSSSLIQGGPSPAQVYQYRVVEVVGWKDLYNNPKVILRGGIGQLWGFNGFIDLELSKYGKYIAQYYAVQLDQSQSTKAQSF